MRERHADTVRFHKSHRPKMTVVRLVIGLLLLVFPFQLAATTNSESGATTFSYILSLGSENYIAIEFYNNISGDPIKDNFYEMEPDSSERGLYYSLETSYDELAVSVSFTPMTMTLASGSFTIPYSVDLHSMNGGSPFEKSVIVSDARNDDTSYVVHVNSDNFDMRGESLYYVMYYTFGSVGADGTFSEMTEEGWDSYPPGTYESTVTVAVEPGVQ